MQKKYLALYCILTALLPFASNIYAQTSEPESSAGLFDGIKSSSAEPKSSDTLFVNGTGDDFDKLLRREEVPNGRAKYRVNIDRYYSHLMTFDAEGLLTNAEAMTSYDLIPETALLSLRVFDVDQEGRADFLPEVDYVIVNGNRVKIDEKTSFSLSSGNQKWSVNAINIPIEFLKFPQTKGTLNSKPKAENIIEIDIDQYRQRWQVLCDWISIEIKSPIRPVLMIHGFGGSADTWKTFKFLFDDYGIPNRVPPSGFMNKYGGVVNNANDILREISATRLIYGVDKVNLVAHSKGGLDTRFYIRTYGREYVERLIQLATPNNGSEKANKLYTAATITKFTLPAARQLTTWWVRDNFNYFAIPHRVPNSSQLVYTYTKRFNSWESKSPYIFILAGIKYTASNWGLLPPHDNNVSLKSATLPWNGTGKEPFIFTEIYPNLPEINDGMFLYEHSEMHEKADVYLATIDLLNRKIPELNGGGNNIPLASNIFDGVNSADSTQNILSETNFIAPNTQKIISINVGQTSGLNMLAASQTGGFTFSIKDPQGTTIDSTSSNFSQSSDEFGKFSQYHFQNPQAGVWQLITKSGSAGLYVLNEAEIITNNKIDISIDSSSYTLNQPILITSEFTDGTQTISGASVTAEVLKSDGTVDSLDLFDDGAHGDSEANDGKYANTYQGSDVPGYIEIKATAVKNNERLTNKTHVAIISNSAYFNGDFSDFTIDSDSDDLIDTLSINVGINVNASGDYLISGILTNNTDSVITSASFTTLGDAPLNAGSQIIQLNFKGSDISKGKFDGPYILKNLSLIDLSSNLQVDFEEQPFTTQTYLHSQFERPFLLLTGNYSETANMRNGKISELLIYFDVDIIAPGYYEYNAELTDTNGNFISWSGSKYNIYSSQLGVIPFLLIFDGNEINKKRLNGPYVVKNLSIYSDRYNYPDANLFEKELYTTEKYNFTEFKGKVIETEVINSETSLPIRNARVFLHGTENANSDRVFAFDSTNGSGRVLFGGINDGSFNLYAQKDSIISDTIYFAVFLDSTAKTINMSIPNTLPQFGNIPDTISFNSNENIFLNLWDFVSDNESSDTTLYFEFTAEPNALNLNFDNSTGILSISAIDTLFSGSVTLNILADDTYGGIAEKSILIMLSGVTNVVEEKNIAPKEYRLFQNYPNPFNPSTTIKYQIPKQSYVTLKVYDVLGREVATLINRRQNPGRYSVTFDAGNLASGLYFYRLKTDNYSQSKKLLLLK